jgi:hypothetical protein
LTDPNRLIFDERPSDGQTSHSCSRIQADLIERHGVRLRLEEVNGPEVNGLSSLTGTTEDASSIETDAMSSTAENNNAASPAENNATSPETNATKAQGTTTGTKVHIIHNDSFENDNNWLSFKMAVDFLATSEEGRDRHMLMIDGDTIVHVRKVYDNVMIDEDTIVQIRLCM